MSIDIKKIIERLKTLDCPPPQLQVMQKREVQTHNLRQNHWGDGYAILQIVNEGQQLRLSVWTWRDIQLGDYLILQNGAATTRYQVEAIGRMVDPPDQKFITAKFAPREAPAE